MFFGTVVGWLTCWIVSYASYDMEHAAPGSVLLRASLEITQRQLRTPRPADGRLG